MSRGPFLVTGSQILSCFIVSLSLPSELYPQPVIGSKTRTGLLASVMGRSTFLCAMLIGLYCSPYYCTWAHHASPWWMEKFLVFLLLQRFLPGIQSHRSSCRKQVTSPQLSPELGCLNFPECGLQSRPRCTWERRGVDRGMRL